MQVDLIFVGSFDFDIQDCFGYWIEEYVLLFDGWIYYCQVFVEQIGFEYDIVVMVFDGEMGKFEFIDNFKDFKSFEGEQVDFL